MTLFEMVAEVNRKRTQYGMMGLGLGSIDIQTAMGRAGNKPCSPIDTTCVVQNQAIQNAVADFVNTYGAIPDDFQMSVDPVGNDAVVAFMNNQPPTAGYTVTANGRTWYVSAKGFNPITVATTPAPVEIPPTVTRIPSNSVPSASTGLTTQSHPGALQSNTQQTQQTQQVQQVQTYNPVFNLTTSRGSGGVYQVGDTWQIAISGAKPGAAISVKGGLNGAQDVTPVGTADSNGMFTMNGTFQTSQVGNWSESWMVNGSIIGSVNFVVAAQPQGVVDTGTQTSTVSSGSASQDLVSNVTSTPSSGGGVTDYTSYIPTSVSTATSGFTTWLQETMVGGIPNWALLAGGIGVLLYMKQSGGRYGR